MFRIIPFALAALATPLLLNSCADEPERPVGPTSTTSTMPWNKPVPGQGQGQMGMLPQNQHRR